MPEMVKCLAKKIRTSLAFAVLFFLSACGGSSFPEELAADRYAFLESVRMIELAGAELLKHPAGSQPFLAALGQLERGYKTGFRVRDVFLDYLDSDINATYNKQLLRGTKNYVEGVRDGNANLQKIGVQQVAFWFDYWAKNKSAILKKLQ